MIYDIFSPSQKLESIVKQYVVINSLDGVENLLFLPNGCNFIVFNRGIKGYTKIYTEDNHFPIPTNYSISIKTNKVESFVLSNEIGSKSISFPMIFAELTPIGYYKLFNKEASVLNTSYEELNPKVIDMYFKELYTHNTIEEELEYLNWSLELIYTSQDSPHLAIYDVIDRISNSYRFEVTVEKLTKEFGCSRSTIEREFKKVVGLTPKNFIFASKFCKTVLAYVEDECTFKELEYLYSDNSHMNAVFKKFLGVSPSVIVKEVANKKIQIYQMQKIK
ncbi:helix-turn-helix domain-containing protein [Sulfurimonas sp. CS5]|jgi:AraC-like DNA-binding protein|uniref:helix-turn-helix domain-containing protein n=1 Tax=Sulfurimonas sp. CS5 TaxID=3391145 RepID=UPI0039EAD1A5